MSKIIITIETDNDAFYRNKEGEVKRILKERVFGREGIMYGSIRDVNGNKVGSIEEEF
jgi:hypothetical protein